MKWLLFSKRGRAFSQKKTTLSRFFQATWSNQSTGETVTCRYTIQKGLRGWFRVTMIHQIYLLGLFRRSSTFQIWQHDRSNNSSINRLSSHSLRMVQPQNESRLRQIVKGNQTGQKSRHALHNADGSKDNPVRQPLCIFPIIGIHRLEGHVSRVDESNQIYNQLSSSKQCQKSRKEKGGK